MTPSQKLSQKNTEKYPHKDLTYQGILAIITPSGVKIKRIIYTAR